MKKKLALATIILTLGALTLTGCGDTERESSVERIDRLYSECVTAGGSFEYNGSLPYWNCEMPKD